jgi:hypothetical protein
MNKGLLIHAGWLAAAAGAFAIGRMTSPSPEGGKDYATSALATGPSGLATPLTAAGSSSPKKNGSDDATKAAASVGGKGGSVLATIDAIKNESDEVTKNFLFAQMLMELNPENAAEMLAALRESGVLGDGRDFGPGGKMGLFFQAWGKIDGKAAVEAALAMNAEDGGGRGPGGMGRAGFGAMAALSAWGSSDPAGALAYMDTMEDGDQKRMMTMGLVNGLASSDPDAASAYILKNIATNAEGADPRAGWMNGRLYETVADEQIKKGIDSAMAWANGLPDGDFKNSALSRIADQYAREDITKAAAWAEGIAGQEGSANAIRQVAERMGRENPQDAIEWLTKLPAGSQDGAIGDTFRRWTEQDSVAASQYLATMPASTSKDNAVAGFARQLDREDPASAMVWANTIADSELQASTVKAVAESWVRSDKDGATAYMQSSGMTAEQQAEILQSATRGGGRDFGGRGGPGGGGRGGR